MGGEKATEAIIQGSQPDPMQESESQKRFCCYWIQSLASLPISKSYNFKTEATESEETLIESDGEINPRFRDKE